RACAGKCVLRLAVLSLLGDETTLVAIMRRSLVPERSIEDEDIAIPLCCAFETEKLAFNLSVCDLRNDKVAFRTVVIDRPLTGRQVGGLSSRREEQGGTDQKRACEHGYSGIW